MLSLPSEIISDICEFLPSDDVSSLSLTCKDLYDQIKETESYERAIWRETPINYLIDKKNISALRYLKNQLIIEDLEYACLHNKGIEVVKFLSSAIKIPKENNILKAAILGRNLSVIEYIITLHFIEVKDDDINTAISSGELSSVIFLRSNFKLPIILNNLYYCCISGYTDIAGYILNISDIILANEAISACFLFTIQSGSLDILKILVQKFPGFDINNSIFITLAIKEGHFDVFEYLYQPDMFIYGNILSEALSTASKYKNFRVLRWLKEKYSTEFSIYYSNLLIDAIMDNNSESLDFFSDLGLNLLSSGFINCIEMACYSGKERSLRYLINKYPPRYNNLKLFKIAIEQGNLNIVKILCEYTNINPSLGNNKILRLSNDLERFEISDYLLSLSLIKKEEKKLSDIRKAFILFLCFLIFLCL